MNRRFYSIATAVVKPIFMLMWPGSKVTGKENVPAEGGFIICANHCHWIDAVYLASMVRKRRITYIAKAETMKNPIAKWFVGDLLGAIPIRRGEADLSAIRTSLKVIADGECLGIFPQGHRSRDNSPTPMMNGVAMIAMRANAPIIPVYIAGPYRLFRKVDIRIGAPIDISDLGRRVDKATMDEVTARISSAIFADSVR